MTTILPPTTNPNPVSPPPMPPHPPFVTSGPVRTDYQNSHDAYTSMYPQPTNPPNGPAQPQPPAGPTEEQQITDQYDNELNSTLGSFDRLSKNMDESSRNLLGTISSTYSQRRADQAESDRKYQKGLEVLGIKSGMSQYAPQESLGLMNEAEKKSHKNLLAIDAEENKARMDADAAKADKDYKTFTDRVNLIKDLRQQKAQALKDLADKSQQPFDLLSKQSDAMEKIGGSIYDELDGLSATEKAKKAQEIADRFHVPIQAVISAGHKYANGLNSSSTGGGYTSQELRKLRQAGIDSTDIKSSDDFLYGGNSKLGDPTYADEKLNLGTDTEAAEDILSVTKDGVPLANEGVLIEIQDLLKQGYSLKAIAKAKNMPPELFDVINKYIE